MRHRRTARNKTNGVGRTSIRFGFLDPSTNYLISKCSFNAPNDVATKSDFFVTEESGFDIFQPLSSRPWNSSPGRTIWSHHPHILRWLISRKCSGSKRNSRRCQLDQNVRSMASLQLQKQNPNRSLRLRYLTYYYHHTASLSVTMTPHCRCTVYFSSLSREIKRVRNTKLKFHQHLQLPFRQRTVATTHVKNRKDILTTRNELAKSRKFKRVYSQVYFL